MGKRKTGEKEDDEQVEEEEEKGMNQRGKRKDKTIEDDDEVKQPRKRQFSLKALEVIIEEKVKTLLHNKFFLRRNK